MSLVTCTVRDIECTYRCQRTTTIYIMVYLTTSDKYTGVLFDDSTISFGLVTKTTTIDIAHCGATEHHITFLRVT